MGACCETSKKDPNYYSKNTNNLTENAIMNNQIPPQLNEGNYNNNYNYSNNNILTNYNNNYEQNYNNKNNNYINYNNNNNNINYDYYKSSYLNQNNLLQNNIPNQNSNQLTQSTYFQLNNELIELEKRFQAIKHSNRFYYEDLKNQDEYISNYKSFINELNNELNDFHDQLHISIYGKKLEENLIDMKEKYELHKDLENISNKVNQLNSILEEQNKELKSLEINYKVIQEMLNEIKDNINTDENNKRIMLLEKNDSISNYIYELEETSKNLERNKILCEKQKAEIEQDINRIQEITNKKVTEVKVKRKTTLKNYNLTEKQNKIMNDPLFLKGSMLLTIKDFSKAKDIFKSIYLFKEEDDKEYEKQDLIKKNWNEICYLYNDYDIYDVNYELKAVGLPENFLFNLCSFGFTLDTDVEILEFQIDGAYTDYKLENFSLHFNINLKNLESCKIHIKYKESPLESKLTEGERKQKKISRLRYYGLSKRLAGQIAKFTLRNESDFEIINFEDEFLIKTNENEYTWGGTVPEGGKNTLVRLSKKEAHYIFIEKLSIKTADSKLINDTKLIIPFCYENGNNQLNKFNLSSKQTQLITKDKSIRSFVIHYLNIQGTNGELTIKGELFNRCKGEWICDLTDEEIESLIPKDFKINKNMFKQIALGIIKQYDEEHKEDLIKVPEVVKIGKWIKKNIKYDINYSGRNDITATDTYNNLEGVCDHFTKLYNALMYSLGYKVIYVLGFAIDKNDSFGKEDAHAWSLIKIGNKWLPFDATWGIFSGKFPVTHVFKQYNSKGIIIKGYDHISIGKVSVKGKFLN